MLKLLPSEHLTENEIDAAALVAPDMFNPQQQRTSTGRRSPVVARAYLDQLARSQALATEKAAVISAALGRAGTILDSGSGDGGAVSKELRTLAAELETARAKAKGVDAARIGALAETVTGIAGRLE